MFSALGFSIGMALLTVPPLPPPPPDRLAAAAELHRVAPFSTGLKDRALEAAVLRASGSALGHAANYLEMLPEAQQRIRERLAGRQPWIEEQAGRCFEEWLGYAFDLTTLQDMRGVVVTKGGYALWERAMGEPVQNCYNEFVSNALVDFTPAISWLAEHKLLARVPRYDPSKRSLGSFVIELETLCGRRARAVLQSRPEGLGMPIKWVDHEVRRTNGDTFLCLNSAAKVAGYDLFVFQN
jgi:hypothetical protein